MKSKINWMGKGSIRMWERILLKLSLNFTGIITDPDLRIDSSTCPLRAQKEQNPSLLSAGYQQSKSCKLKWNRPSQKKFVEQYFFLKLPIHEHGVEWSVERSLRKSGTVWVMHWRVAFKKHVFPILLRPAPCTWEKIYNIMKNNKSLRISIMYIT